MERCGISLFSLLSSFLAVFIPISWFRRATSSHPSSPRWSCNTLRRDRENISEIGVGGALGDSLRLAWDVETV
ncbi:hypothetical protein C8J56DRAFT_969635 [Mycena floridula]|nr:hypothetical protein C8J56DRAFT_969635 [Mycena floridula]